MVLGQDGIDGNFQSRVGLPEIDLGYQESGEEEYQQ